VGLEKRASSFLMKKSNHIHVSCAIIEHDGLVLAARRGLFMRLPLKWEFPGGKIDPKEDPRTCLLREIREELDMAVAIHTALIPVSHRYPFFGVDSALCLKSVGRCRLSSGCLS
jgi:mutator protein MutT